MRKLTLVAALAGLMTLVGRADQQASPFLGAWNINGTGPDAAIIYWLEVTESGGELKGMFLNRVGNPNPLGSVKIEGDELIFREGTAARPGQEYRAKIENGKLVGHHSVRQGGGRNRNAVVDPAAPPPPAPTERVVNWVGVRPPKWPAADANAKHTYGTPVVLFDAKGTLDTWDVQTPGRPMNWSIADGVLTNGARANNLVSKQKFYNFKIEAEYKLEAHSNSGIYIRGRYELQLLEDHDDANGRPDFGHMAIYGRTAPLVKASKPAGEWQTMVAIIVENRVTATLNGQRVQNNAVIPGVTGGMLDNDELSPGPLLVQGDHGAVFIRKLVVTPITK